MMQGFFDECGGIWGVKASDLFAMIVCLPGRRIIGALNDAKVARGRLLQSVVVATGKSLKHRIWHHVRE
jgi:hypothetical protein